MKIRKMSGVRRLETAKQTVSRRMIKI